MHRIKLITTDPSFTRWKSKRRKLKEVRDELNTMANADFTIDVEYRKLTPEVVNGRITHDWMDGLSGPLLADGYHFVAFHMGDKQRKRWGIRPTLRGAHQVDTDLVSELYFWADERTKRTGNFNQFVQTFLHEMRHAIMRGMGLPDDTHEQHEDGQIKGSFEYLDMAMFNPAMRNQQFQVSKLARAIGYLERIIGTRPRSLSAASQSFLGRDASPRDLAPDVVGCAESVSMIIREVLPDFPIITGTWTLNDQLQKDRRFAPTEYPMPGDIIISPTGTVANAPYPGHVGIVHRGVIASNNSYSGYWEENYTFAAWHRRWADAGFPVHYYRLIL